MDDDFEPSFPAALIQSPADRHRCRELLALRINEAFRSARDARDPNVRRMYGAQIDAMLDLYGPLVGYDQA